MPKRAEVSGEEDEAATETDAEASVTTVLVGADAVSIGVETATLLGLGSFLGAVASVTVAVTVTAGVDSAEVAVEEVLDVLTILSDYTHISSVFLSSFQYILYIVILYFIIT
jgi:hypothetical protein